MIAAVICAAGDGPPRCLDLDMKHLLIAGTRPSRGQSAGAPSPLTMTHGVSEREPRALSNQFIGADLSIVLSYPW